MASVNTAGPFYLRVGIKMEDMEKYHLQTDGRMVNMFECLAAVCAEVTDTINAMF